MLRLVPVFASFVLLAITPALAQSEIALEPGENFEWDYNHEDTTFTHGNLRLHLSFDRSEAGQDWIDGATLSVSGVDGEDFTISSEAGLSGFGQVGVFPIDRQGGLSIVFGAYTGGAHCCMNTLVARLAQDAPQIERLGYHDGDYVEVNDLDGDGLYEFKTRDERFNYTFDSYASSFAPVMVMTTVGGTLVEVTTEPQFRTALKSDMAVQSSYCGGEQGWFAGACAALAANAARIGRYEEIRAKITHHLETGRFDSGWDDFSFCTDDECDSSEEFTSFPEALDFALERWGYI